MAKRVTILLGLLFVFTLTWVGCATIQDGVNEFKALHPEVKMDAVDENEDGFPDYMGLRDADGEWIMGSNGLPMEKAGSRAHFTKKKMVRLQELEDANQLDKLAAKEFDLWSDVMPPGVAVVFTGIAGIFARLGPAKKLVKWKQMFEETVFAIEQGKDNISPAAWAKFRALVGDVSDTTYAEIKRHQKKYADLPYEDDETS